jgi:hypothetical protein
MKLARVTSHCRRVCNRHRPMHHGGRHQSDTGYHGVASRSHYPEEFPPATGHPPPTRIQKLKQRRPGGPAAHEDGDGALGAARWPRTRDAAPDRDPFAIAALRISDPTGENTPKPFPPPRNPKTLGMIALQPSERAAQQAPAFDWPHGRGGHQHRQEHELRPHRSFPSHPTSEPLKRTRTPGPRQTCATWGAGETRRPKHGL